MQSKVKLEIEIILFLKFLKFLKISYFWLQVTGVVGRAEMLSSIFYLMALMNYSKCTAYRSKTGNATQPVGPKQVMQHRLQVQNR